MTRNQLRRDDTAKPDAAEQLNPADLSDSKHDASNPVASKPIGSKPTLHTVMPDARAATLEASKVAAVRQKPLRAEQEIAVSGTNGNGANGTHEKNGRNGSHQSNGTSVQPQVNDLPATASSANLFSAPWGMVAQAAVNGTPAVDIMRTLQRIEPQMAQMEREIDRLITTPVKVIADIAQHTLGAGGKRLRPALVITAAQLCGDNPERSDPRVVTCAAAMELIHTTSLIHDDVVDSASMRRGKPAANLVWGNETSVLVGDFLFAQVFVTVAQKGFNDLLAPIANATSQLCAGELLETQTRGLLTMKEKQYCDIIALKTAALTECSCRLGAMAMGASEVQIEHLARYGREIGMAFQIVDDVFDIVATEGKLGKPVGNDIREGDITLPMLRAAQVVKEDERAELGGLLGRDDITAEQVARALEIIRGTDAVEHCYKVAADYVASARSQLEIFEDTPARAMLFDIADYVVSRDR
jgi:geranylgeranyl pyrophosphate synthase